MKTNKKIRDIAGERFGRLVAVELAYTKNGSAYWKCSCDCGNVKVIVLGALCKGHTKSCGCLRKETRSVDLTNIKFGRLTAVILDHTNHENFWKCQCECGNITVVRASSLRSGKTQSCGCLHRDASLKFELTEAQFEELTKQLCHYCGAAPVKTFTTTNGKYVYNGIDRIDNNVGYILENCVPCCKFCNRAKDTLTYDEFVNNITRIYENLQRSNVCQV